MSNISAKNSSGLAVYLKSAGTGSDPDPWIPEHSDANLGAKADAVATTDIGTFSLIALFKRLLQGMTTLNAGAKDGGLGMTITRTFTQNNDISTARDITAAPTAGQKIVAIDCWVSVDTAGYVTIQMETSGNVLAGAYVPANSSIPFTLRGMLKGDTADKKLQMKSTVASKGACTCIYFSEA